MAPSPDGDPVRMLGDDLLETLRDRLLDLSFFEFNKGPARSGSTWLESPLAKGYS
jgi:hypothetical protein